jgi:membrane carboxypeptidase/penicillin-binding protein PbpC
VNDVDPEGGGITIQWFLNGELVGTEPSYTFKAEYTGEYSSDNSPFYVKVAVSDTYGYEGKTGREYTNHTWILSVENVNRAPVIESSTPPDSTITIDEGENKTFSIINASDPEGNSIGYAWYLNNELVPDETDSSYTFYSEHDSAGVYIVKVVVSDDETNISHVWTLTVSDVNRAFRVEGFVPNETTLEMKKGMAKTFSVSASDPDGDNTLTIKWYVNGEKVGSGEMYTFIPESYGTYILSVTLPDGEKTETSSWTINVKEPEETPGFEITFLLMILGVLIILRKIKK